MEMQNGSATLETVWQVHTEFNIYLPPDSAILPLDILPREIKTYAHKKMCTQCHGAIIYNSSKLEATYVFINW